MQWFMDRTVYDLYDTVCDANQAGDEAGWRDALKDLKKAVTESCEHYHVEMGGHD